MSRTFRTSERPSDASARRWARARWWVPGLAVAVALTSVPSAALAAEQPPDWRPAVQALSGATPEQTSTVLLGAADVAVEGDPDTAVTRATDHLVEDAADRFYGDGLRVTSRIDLVAVGLAEGLASGVLAVKADAAGTAPLAASRTDALVDTLSAAVRSARTSLDDARRVTGVTPSAATVPAAPNDASSLASGLGTLTSGPSGSTAKRLGVAAAHVAAMDAALDRSQPVRAVAHATAAQAWAVGALESVGVKPHSTKADADGDGLPDPLELSLGTHPKQKDSDGDGLRDGDEAAHLLGATIPTVKDSDGDGTGDAQEDSDGDGLDNKAEIYAGTNPLTPDEDADTLADPDELTAGTDPAVADTDADGLLDGPEVRSGLDPLAADSDGDGVGDADEVVEQPVTKAGVGLSIVGAGDLASTVHVATQPTSEQDKALGAVGDSVELALPADRAPALQQAQGHVPVPARTSPRGPTRPTCAC